MNQTLIGLLILLLVFLYMWFVAPPEDKYGRFTANAYGTAIGLIAAFVTGCLLVLIPFGV